MLRRTWLAACLSAGLVGGWLGAPAVCAARPSSPALSAEQKALVEEATDYIQNLKSIEGRFVQNNPPSPSHPQGSTSTGTLYIDRPGKARFQYDPNGALLVVSDGKDVNIYDQRLKSFQKFPLARTPLILLLAPEVRLDRGAVITNVEQYPGGFSITARDARHQAQGSITLYFSSNPVALRGWALVDAQRRLTRVTLSAFKSVPSLDPALFVLHDPRRRASRP